MGTTKNFLKSKIFLKSNTPSSLRYASWAYVLYLWPNLLERTFSNVVYYEIGPPTIDVGCHVQFFHAIFFVIRKKNNISLSIFCQKLPFLAQNVWFFFLKSKNGVLEIFLKSNNLCTKILGTVKIFLKSKNFLKSNMLKSTIHCNY